MCFYCQEVDTEERMAILLGVTAMAGASNSILQVKNQEHVGRKGL